MGTICTFLALSHPPVTLPTRIFMQVPFELSFRLWDTYLAEGHRFADFLVYACASFLMLWKDVLEPLEFQDIIMFLQKPPTQVSFCRCYG